MITGENSRKIGKIEKKKKKNIDKLFQDDISKGDHLWSICLFYQFGIILNVRICSQISESKFFSLRIISFHRKR